jgi:hypothetical protein
MSNVFYNDRADIILGLCSHIVNIASQRTDKFLDDPHSNKDKFLNYYAEYLSIIIQTIIRKAEHKLAKEECQYMVDRVFILATWLAVETRGFFLKVQQKAELLDEIRQLCANRIDYYLKCPASGSDSDLYNFAKEITKLDGSYPGPFAILGQEQFAVIMLEQINIDQFLEYYESCVSK